MNADSDSKDISSRVATNVTKPNVRKRRRSSPRRKKRLTTHRSVDRKRPRRSALAHNQHLVPGSCDNDAQVGIRTRRMSAADVCVDQKPTANLVAAENVTVDNCSRLSSASTAPATASNVPTEVTGLCSTVSVAKFTANVKFFLELCTVVKVGRTW